MLTDTAGVHCAWSNGLCTYLTLCMSWVAVSVRSGNQPVATEVPITLCPSEDTDHWKFTLLRAHFGEEMPEHLYDLLRPSGGPEAETKIYRLRSLGHCPTAVDEAALRPCEGLQY